ncbi:MAG: replication factor C large subunit, partial [Candidatus Diapherotrites archaeon]|nr:replication factor C large subunit [Candidatus Diapherotrites archaeon]
MDEKQFLWTDKYAPKDLSEVMGHSKQIHEIKSWASSWESGKKEAPLLIAGPPGIGKTVLAYAIAKEMGWDIVESNASDKRTQATVTRFIGNVAEMGSFSGARRLLLVDEVDGMQGNSDRGGMAALAKILRAPVAPVILTANDAYKVSLRSVRGLCKLVKLGKVNYRSIGKRLKDICDSEGIKYDPDALNTIAERSGSDVRAAILDLQNIAEGADEVTMKAVEVLGHRDIESGALEVIRRIFKTMHFDHAIQAVREAESGLDLDTIMAWIDENLPYEYEYPYDLANAYPWLSRADVFNGRIMRRQYYGFWNYTSALISAGIALSKVEPYHKFFVYKYPSNFTNMAKNKPRKTMEEGISEKLKSKVPVSKKVMRNSYIPMIKFIARNNKKKFTEMIAQFEFSEEEIEYLSKLKEKEIKKL